MYTKKNHHFSGRFVTGLSSYQIFQGGKTQPPQLKTKLAPMAKARVLRIGWQVDPPTIGIHCCREGGDNEFYFIELNEHRALELHESSPSGVLQDLVQKYPDIVGPSVANQHQLLRIISRVLPSLGSGPAEQKTSENLAPSNQNTGQDSAGSDNDSTTSTTSQEFGDSIDHGADASSSVPAAEELPAPADLPSVVVPTSFKQAESAEHRSGIADAAAVKPPASATVDTVDDDENAQVSSFSDFDASASLSDGDVAQEDTNVSGNGVEPQKQNESIDEKSTPQESATDAMSVSDHQSEEQAQPQEHINHLSAPEALPDVEVNKTEPQPADAVAKDVAASNEGAVSKSNDKDSDAVSSFSDFDASASFDDGSLDADGKRESKVARESNVPDPVVAETPESTTAPGSAEPAGADTGVSCDSQQSNSPDANGDIEVGTPEPQPEDVVTEGAAANNEGTVSKFKDNDSDAVSSFSDFGASASFDDGSMDAAAKPDTQLPSESDVLAPAAATKPVISKEATVPDSDDPVNADGGVVPSANDEGSVDGGANTDEQHTHAEGPANEQKVGEDVDKISSFDDFDASSSFDDGFDGGDAKNSGDAPASEPSASNRDEGAILPEPSSTAEEGDAAKPTALPKAAVEQVSSFSDLDSADMSEPLPSDDDDADEPPKTVPTADSVTTQQDTEQPADTAGSKQATQDAGEPPPTADDEDAQDLQQVESFSDFDASASFDDSDDEGAEGDGKVDAERDGKVDTDREKTAIEIAEQTAKAAAEAKDEAEAAARQEAEQAEAAAAAAAQDVPDETGAVGTVESITPDAASGPRSDEIDTGPIMDDDDDSVESFDMDEDNFSDSLDEIIESTPVSSPRRADESPQHGFDAKDGADKEKKEQPRHDDDDDDDDDFDDFSADMSDSDDYDDAVAGTPAPAPALVKEPENKEDLNKTVKPAATDEVNAVSSFSDFDEYSDADEAADRVSAKPSVEEQTTDAAPATESKATEPTGPSVEAAQDEKKTPAAAVTAGDDSYSDVASAEFSSIESMEEDIEEADDAGEAKASAPADAQDDSYSAGSDFDDSDFDD